MDEQTQQGLEDLLAEAEDDPRIAAVLQYGSSLTEGPSRDVDVCLVLDEATDPSEDLLDDFGFASGERHEGLDVSVFQRLPLQVRHRVLDDHRVLHVKDEDELYEIATQVAREWERFRPFYHEYLEAVARG